MSDSRPYRVAGPAIVSDVIDGDAIVVNLTNGDYYTFGGVGRTIWELVAQGCTRGMIHSHLTRLYQGAPDEISTATDAFLERLIAEGLIVRVDSGCGPGLEPPGSERDAGSFSPPVVVKYTDMEDLLTLDPVHEVDEQGWPTVKRQDPS